MKRRRLNGSDLAVLIGAPREPGELLAFLAKLAEQDVDAILTDILALKPPLDYAEVAFLGRRLASAANAVVMAGEDGE